jgi:pyrroline-5-carboxylate reductase
MHFQTVSENGLGLVGCGNMGSALLRGWLSAGLSPSAITVIDPRPSDWLAGLQAHGLRLNQDMRPGTAVCVLAVKPQIVVNAAPQIANLGNGRCIFISVAAGTILATLQTCLGGVTPVVRAMPNTPAAIGQGITALVANEHVSGQDLTLSERLMQAIGRVVVLQDETQMDAVTAVSGSGPAYVFHLIEALATAGEIHGLPADIALELARATVSGAGAMALQSNETPGQLRQNVTSPNGTTAAALEVLMDDRNGFNELLKRVVAAAKTRSQEHD